MTTAQAVAGAYPDDPLSYALLGAACYNSGQSGQAATHLHRSLELNPRQPEVYEILGRIAYEKGNLDEATRLCRLALKHGPPTPEVLNLLGKTLMDEGNTEEAVQTLQQATSQNPPLGESFYLLGQARMQSSDYKGAKASFLRAADLVPDHTQAFFGLYTACSRLGEVDEARRYRERFQELEKTDRQALRNRSAQEDSLSGLPLLRKTAARTLFGASQIYQAHKELATAVDLKQRAALLDAENPAYRANLESFFLQQNQPAQAVAAFQRLVNEQPENYLNHFFLARVYGRLQQWELAEKAYLKVQELAPSWSAGYRGLAELYLRANHEFPAAQRLARKVVELDPTGSNYYLLGVASYKNNDNRAAVAAMKRALEINPGETRYLEFLQELQRLTR